MILGISHITIMVEDLERTSRLLCEGLGASEVYDSKDKNRSIAREKFFILGDTWLVAMQGEKTEKSYRHVAFRVDPGDLPELEKRITKLGATVVPSRPRIRGEGASVYFYDFDNNFFELHSGTLEERLNSYRPSAVD